MCILFYYLNDSPSSNEYRLVLANNRDEFLQRPTLPAGFWENNEDVISGRDMEPGREGGTWFGVSKKGKIGILLNVLEKQEDDKLGRGSLVCDYLLSPHNGQKHMQQLDSSSAEYNPFSLITMELNANHPSSTQYLCQSYLQNGCKHAEFGPGIHAFSNSHFSTPWNKPTIAKEKLAALISQHNCVSQQEILVEKLLTALNDKTQHMPDDTLRKCLTDAYGNGEDVIDTWKYRSAISVWLPKMTYASRTNTVFLVDSEWNCEFTERTVEDFSDLDNLKWKTRTFKFKLTPFDISLNSNTDPSSSL